jgi:quercetin dioxygenase-like cupin family protein
MQRCRAFAMLIPLTGFIAFSGVVSAQAPPSNTTRHTTRADVAPQAAPLEVVQLTIDFVPGAASSIHYHSGVSHNTVLAGELTIRYADGERRVGVGEGWTDEPGVVHQAFNLGDKPATVVASFVQTKGAMVTIPVASFRAQNPTLPRALPNAGDGSCEADVACE